LRGRQQVDTIIFCVIVKGLIRSNETDEGPESNNGVPCKIRSRILGWTVLGAVVFER